MYSRVTWAFEPHFKSRESDLKTSFAKYNPSIDMHNPNDHSERLSGNVNLDISITHVCIGTDER